MQYVYSGLSLLKYSSRENRDFSPLFIHSRRDGRLDQGIGGDILPTLALQSCNEPDGLISAFRLYLTHTWTSYLEEIYDHVIITIEGGPS